MYMYAPPNAMKIDAAAIDQFARDGAICLRQAFDARWLEELARGMEKNFAEPGPYYSSYTPPDACGGFYGDYCNWQRIAEYEAFIRRSPAGEIAGRLMAAEAARIYHEHVLVKEPHTAEATPWHHDLPYYGLAGEQLCSIWLPLEAVPQRACPRFLRGSHASGALYYPRLFVNHEDYSAGVDGFESMPDIDAMVADGGARVESAAPSAVKSAAKSAAKSHASGHAGEKSGGYAGARGGEKSSQKSVKKPASEPPTYTAADLLSWSLVAGDCIVFHMRAVHDAPPTLGHPERRRGFSTRWLGEDARFATRPWETSPPFPQLRLAPGDSLEHPLFPVIWRR